MLPIMDAKSIAQRSIVLDECSKPNAVYCVQWMRGTVGITETLHSTPAGIGTRTESIT